jgi:hypothetical protein
MPEDMGGPVRVDLSLGAQPSAPPLMAATGVQPSAPPTMTTMSYASPLVDPFTGQEIDPNELLAGVERMRSFNLNDLPWHQYTEPTGITFTTNRGRVAAGDGATGYAAFDPNATYRVIDLRNKGRVVYTGTGQEGLQGAYLASQQLIKQHGKKGNWKVEQLDPNTGTWTSIARDKPAKGILGKIADIVLPIAGTFIPGVGPVLGAALGSAASSVAQGRSLENTLLRAGLSAGASYLGGQLPIGSDASRVATQKAAQGVTQGTAQGVTPGLAQAVGEQVARQVVEAAIPEIIVPGSLKAAALGIGSMLGAGIGSVATGALSGVRSVSDAINTTQQPQPAQQDPGEIVVPGRLQPASPPNVVSPAAAAGSAAPGLVYDPQGNLSEIVITGSTPQNEPNVGATLGAAPGVIYSPGGQVDEIVVPGRAPTQEPAISPAEAAVLLGTGAAGAALAGGGTGGSAPAQRGNTLDDIIRYLSAASLGLGLIDNLFGGGGGQGTNRIPAGFGNGQLRPVFGSSMPAPTLLDASDNFAQRPVNLDWYRYGYGPGQSFFNYVPQRQANTSTAYTGYAQGGLAAGSMPHASGRSDDIPALLSDGEYVIDAETVALLGDGSTKAGADRLDAFRVNIRKHKGRQLAKGRFSPDAKPPERYMHGGVA